MTLGELLKYIFVISTIFILIRLYIGIKILERRIEEQQRWIAELDNTIIEVDISKDNGGRYANEGTIIPSSTITSVLKYKKWLESRKMKEKLDKTP